MILIKSWNIYVGRNWFELSRLLNWINLCMVKFANIRDWAFEAKPSKNINGLMQDCGNSSALALELSQSCIKPMLWCILSILQTSTYSVGPVDLMSYNLAIRVSYGLYFLSSKSESLPFMLWYCIEFLNGLIFFQGNTKIYLHFLYFLNADMAQEVAILPYWRQGTIYIKQSIPWLLMSWRHKEPGHQKPWYWPSSPEILQLKHQNSKWDHWRVLYWGSSVLLITKTWLIK